jgi:hypothetical protein
MGRRFITHAMFNHFESCKYLFVGDRNCFTRLYSSKKFIHGIICNQRHFFNVLWRTYRHNSTHVYWFLIRCFVEVRVRDHLPTFTLMSRHCWMGASSWRYMYNVRFIYVTLSELSPQDNVLLGHILIYWNLSNMYHASFARFLNLCLPMIVVAE